MAAIAASDSASSTSGTPAHCGECFARQVVLRRPEAAGHHDQVGPLTGDPEGRQMVFQHVAQRRVERDRDPERPRAAD